MINSLLMKLNNFFSNGKILSSIFAADGEVVSTVDPMEMTGVALSSATNWFIDLAINIIYSICAFVMSIIELMQVTVTKMLGIDVDISDYVLIDRNNPLIGILSSEIVTKVFKYLIGLAIILVIVFTIFAIIKSEYNYAAKDGPFINKTRIIARSARSFFTMGIFPFMFLFVIVIVNAILAGFNNILSGGNNPSMAGQIFVSSAYNANNYRKYANNDVRIPIIIDFEDPISLGQESGYTTRQLAGIYQSFEKTGKSLYENLSLGNFDAFIDTVSYKNNKVINTSKYKGYEKFICTPEQYYVMADFIDYAMKYNITYHVKNIADEDIDWGYVDNTVFDKNAGTLTITYKDNSYINDGESYTVVYAPDSLDTSTPISDAIDTISAMLGIGEYEDNVFNVLNRLEDSINVVEWKSDLAYLKLSDWFVGALEKVEANVAASGLTDENLDAFRSEEILKLLNSGAEVYEDTNENGKYDIDEPFTDYTANNYYTDGVYDAGATEADKIIYYEFCHFKYNNTLNYTIDQLAEGVELPVYQLDKRYYQISTASYIVTASYYVVFINNSYYQVFENPDLRDADNNILTDEYGSYYYTLPNDSIEPPVFSVNRIEDTLSDGEYYTSYKINTPEDTWSDIIVEKINGKRTEYTEAEKIYYDVENNNKYDPGDRFEDTNGNGKWDDAHEYITLYDDQATKVIKHINWPEKLIKDLQVIYSDININQLISTNKWLEQLGEFVQAGGAPMGTTGNISTGLIHPLGLIMSEFFLGEVSEPDVYNDYGSLKYSSKYDSRSIKALLLAAMGEENYFQLDAELDYFCEMFNAYMGPVLDEIAYFENFDLLSGNQASMQLYTYKAYLASMLLSSSAVEWMYDTANLLVGNTQFSYAIKDNVTGGYKAFDELVDCSTCGGDGFLNCTICNNDSSKVAECETCLGTGKGNRCVDCKGIESPKHMAERLYALYNEILKEQYVTEDDASYPEFMVALKNYIDNDEYNSFDGRLECVLTSWRTDVHREWQVVKAYHNIKTMYNKLMLTCDTNGADPELNDLQKLINSIIIVPVGEYVGIGADGKERFKYSDIAGDEDRYLNKIYSFSNDGDIDEFTRAEISSSVQRFVDVEYDKDNPDTTRDIYDDMNELLTPEKLSNVLGSVDYSNLRTDIDNYYKAIQLWANVKIDFLQQDNAYKYAGKRGELKSQLIQDKLSIITNLTGERIAEVTRMMLDGNLNADEYAFLLLDAPLRAAKIADEIESIDFRSGWDELKLGTYDFYYETVAIKPPWMRSFNEYITINPTNKAIKNYINTQDTIDRLDRYNITFAIGSICSQTTSTELRLSVSNKVYTVGQNFTRAKFIEYVLGGKKLIEMGYNPVFVDNDYEGLVEIDYNGNVTGGFSTLCDFLVELGDISAVVYQMTNFVNLSSTAQDSILIGGDEFTNLWDVDGTGVFDESIDYVSFDFNNNDKYDGKTLAQYILAFIVENDFLTPDLISALFGLEITTGVNEMSVPYVKFYNPANGKEVLFANETSINKALKKMLVCGGPSSNILSYYSMNSVFDIVDLHRVLNNVLSYLMLSDSEEGKKNYVDYTQLTLKEFRLMCFDFLINYEEQENESVKQNEQRYLAVLALACADWYTYDNPNTLVIETDANVQFSAKNNSWTIERKNQIAGFRTDKQSQATILRLAGLENRPYEELVGAEYTINFDRDGVDEANGDVFIICTYDENRMLYVPFLMGNYSDYSIVEQVNIKTEAMKEDGYNGKWSRDYGYSWSNTEYYVGNYLYPIVAKGIVTSEGKPTAIRLVNNNIEYYRDDVIIHDVSDVGLSSYFMSMDQVTVNYTALSFVTNAISKLFTGKTLVENIVEKIPKFATSSDYNFCFGTERHIKETSLNGSCSIDYNFNDSICISMDNLYTKKDINMLVLVIGVFLVTAALWKALWGITQRTIDLAMLYLISPPIISTMALRQDSYDEDKKGLVESNSDAYSKWRATLVDKLLSVFSYAIGFNIFFIVADIIPDINLFESQAELNEVVKNLSIFRNLKMQFVNEIGRLVLLVAAAFLSTRATDLFSKVLNVKNGLKEGGDVYKNVKNTVKEVADHASGQYLMDKMADAKDSAKQLIPGYAFGSKISGSVREWSDNRTAKSAEKRMTRAGVDPQTAEKMAKKLRENIKNERAIKKNHKADRQAARKKRNEARGNK